jgi:hypothetical protein
VADRREDGVGGIAVTAFEIAAAEVDLRPSCGRSPLRSRNPSQLTFDDAEHATLLARDEDAVRVFHIMAAVSFVDKGARDSAAGEFFGDHRFEGVTVAEVGPCLRPP